VVPLGTVHVAVSKRIFRFNQCVFSIVLNFGVSVDEIAGDHNQVRVRRISLFDPGQRARHGLKVNQKLLLHGRICTTMNICTSELSLEISGLFVPHCGSPFGPFYSTKSY
jgi:hypothetical protein